LWENNIIQNHIGYLESNKIPKLPQIPIETTTDFSHFQIQYCLYDLPLNNLCQDVETKNIFLKLSDELIARTISENLTSAINRHSQPRKWNNFILNWVTYFANSLKIEEIRHHILKPLQDNWNKFPELMSYLLYGFITNQIYCADKPNGKSLEIWKEICNWILDHLDHLEITIESPNKYFYREVEQALQLIIFTYHHSSLINSNWQYADLFIDIFDKWVNLLGHKPDYYSNLLIMLNRIGWQFAPEKTLDWLDKCSKNATQEFSSEKLGNAQETAVLLNRIWNSYEKQIRRNNENLSKYSNLVDTLVVVGVPLASTLQEKLENRK
jgi:hypothetical protein